MGFYAFRFYVVEDDWKCKGQYKLLLQNSGTLFRGPQVLRPATVDTTTHDDTKET